MFKGLLFVASLAIVGGGGFLAGANKLPFDVAALDSWLAERTSAAVKVEATGKIIYYRHPDGKPVYSARPMKTEDGREFTAVNAAVNFPTSAEVKFPSYAGVADVENWPFFGGRPRGFAGGA